MKFYGKFFSLLWIFTSVSVNAQILQDVSRSLSTESGKARHVQGQATGSIHVLVVDNLLVQKDHVYRFTFQDSAMDNGNRKTVTFSLRDTTAQQDVIIDAPLFDNETGEVLAYRIQGLYITFDNPDGYSVNDLLSGWNDPQIYNFEFSIFEYSDTHGYAEAADYQIEFSDIGVDSSFECPLTPTRILPLSPVNFKAKNLTTSKYIDFGFYERDCLPNEEGMFTGFTDRTRADQIIFVDDARNHTWVFTLADEYIDTTKRNPQPGDVATIILHKPFSSNDIFDLNIAEDLTFVEMQKSNRPQSFELKQNYPNPFNPTTTIEFSLPSDQVVNLTVYNLLGQPVAALFDHQLMPAGRHSILFEAGDMPSGSYIYSIEAGELRVARRMVILK